MLQATWHISLPFITTGPGTDSGGPVNIKLPNQSGPVFVSRSSSSFFSMLLTTASSCGLLFLQEKKTEKPNLHEGNDEVLHWIYFITRHVVRHFSVSAECCQHIHEIHLFHPA